MIGALLTKYYRIIIIDSCNIGWILIHRLNELTEEGNNKHHHIRLRQNKWNYWTAERKEVVCSSFSWLIILVGHSCSVTCHEKLLENWTMTVNIITQLTRFLLVFGVICKPSYNVDILSVWHVACSHSILPRSMKLNIINVMTEKMWFVWCHIVGVYLYVSSHTKYVP